jgi:hypothetical protein
MGTLWPGTSDARLVLLPQSGQRESSQVVAAVVLMAALTTLASAWYWLLIPLAYGF